MKKLIKLSFKYLILAVPLALSATAYAQPTDQQSIVTSISAMNLFIILVRTVTH
jgi:hypothetical protein